MDSHPTGSPGTVKMTPEHWQKVKEILEAALDRDERSRPGFLDAACEGAPHLRADVEALLALDGETETFLSVPAFDLHDAPLHPSLEGSLVDRYRIVREIGAGGMGRVYLAERADRAFEQRVALKVLKRGLDTEEIVDRFRRERQILADLEHPNIARILDGGTTEDDLPYLVTEYVDGIPLDRYCEHWELPIEDRLKLFCQVCDAVQFAHKNVVVHRDLKAANILVTEDDVPKLLDFGIAKILAPEGEDPYKTRLGARFMTPEVASPEQLRGERVTTATDIYSLGVLLYGLLTGRNPHTARGASLQAVERAVREELPERPSAVAPVALRRKIRGDLDDIVLKALRKETERRYGMAQELADDVRRYLEGLPVHASGDGWSYRLPKLLKKHWLAAASVAGFVGLVVLFAVIAFSLLAEATRERLRAERVSGLLEEILTLPEPARARGEELTVREALDAGREAIFADLEGEPRLRAELMSTMARVYRSLGLYDDARTLLTEALETRRQVYGSEHLAVAETLHDLAGVMRDLGDVEAAERLLEEALAIQRKHHAEDDPEFAKGLNNLAILLEERREYGRAAELHREVLATKRRTLGPADPEVAVSLHNLAKLVFLAGDHAEAEALYRKALGIRERQSGPVSPEVARTLNGLASAVEAQGRTDEAEALYRRSLEVRRTLYPDGHPEVAVTQSNLAMLLQGRGDAASAELLYREALETLGRFLPERHPSRAVVMRNLASVLTDRGQAIEAEELARRSLSILQHGTEPSSWRAADAESVLGGALLAQGRIEEATPLLLGSYTLLRDLRGRNSPYTRQALERVVGLYERTEDQERAARYRALAGR